MSRILWVEPAENDLDNIEQYIRIHLRNKQASERIVDGIHTQVEKLESICEIYPL